MSTVIMQERPNTPTKAQRKSHPVALTALIYLTEALVYERYEECLDCLSIALEFGAEGWEINNLLQSDLSYVRATFIQA